MDYSGYCRGSGPFTLPILTNLLLASVAKLNVVLRSPVLNQKPDIPKIYKVGSVRTDCHRIIPNTVFKIPDLLPYDQQNGSSMPRALLAHAEVVWFKRVRSSRVENSDGLFLL